MRGLAGTVCRVCNSGRVPMLTLRCCDASIGPVVVRLRSRMFPARSGEVDLPFSVNFGLVEPLLSPASLGDFARLAPSLNQCLTQASCSLSGCW